jgi:type II secretory ATPase GspE/PulE/Tfp pilus assembly ATPase PilB-like protein
VRRLCLDCREPYRPTSQERERLFDAYGIEATSKDMIYRRDRITEVLREAKKGGMPTLIQDGVRKILAGLTDLSAVTLVASH